MDDYFSNILFFFATELETTIAPESWLSIALKVFSVIVLVFINGFFVAAEFAFVAVRKTRIEALAAEGKAAAKRLLQILDNMSAYLSASQLGITLASLGLGALGEPVVEAMLGNVLNGLSEWWRHLISYGIAFIIITSLHIVLGEQAPKLFGLAVAERVAMGTALPMIIFYKIFKPFIHALDWASAKTVNLFGLEATSEHASIYTEEEIRQLIKVSEASGHVNKEERRLINRVFEFSETTVREAMIPRTEISAISAASTLEEIAHAFRQYGYSRLPVYRESLDDIAGVIHSKDVMSYLLRPQIFRLDKVLQKPVYIVDTARLEDVLRQMQRAKAHFGFVVDEHGGVEGIITLEDLLEEIVGDISDEHDEEVNEQIRKIQDDVYLLDGSLAVRDLNRRLDLNLPVSEGYTTVAGFLMSESGQILKEGEAVPFNGHVFKIEKVDKRRILRVRMEKS
ncbi:MAG: HlyC/CorC family transporter [Acidobacteria bacterium]|jgi:CBS domain containing-hemolysin-like protein|nr:HlyC/CorC family transporter [Acidobacteriota bacterium]MBA3783948.1 HlyC/CorC family transporter [Acidobacteriota bacterium]MBA4122611.1 HlyC/CorC family transporter [Acidobacteriota bacterium]MBA4182418.1 HlyC/CorC family transporter [Acidobacteriota bacterium]